MENKQRNYALDFLKIVATILIVWHHYQQTLEIKFDKINFFYGKFYFGYMVEFFFVLSGFLMFSYIKKIEEGLSFKKFFLKRISRLLPLIIVAVIVYEILIVIYSKVYGILFLGQSFDFFGSIISMLAIQAGWFFKNPMINNPMWYVSVLILCYLIFYLLFNFLNRKNKIIKCLVMILLGIIIQRIGWNLPFLNGYTARGYYSFFSGVLLSIYLQEYKLKKGFKFLICIFGILLSFFVIKYYGIMVKVINYILTFFYYPLLITIFSSINGRLKIFSNKIIGIIGEVSFDVYVWHVCGIILLTIINKYYTINLSSYKTMFVFTLILYLFGFISYFFIEKPIRNYTSKKIN